MPKTKSYYDRKKILNDIFRSPRNYTIHELVQRVSEKLGKSISEKTIRNDISAIKLEALEKNGELKCIAGRYTYIPKTLNLFEVKISPAHIEKIKLAASLLKQIPGLDVHEELNHIFEELNMKADCENKEIIIQFDTRPNYEGAKYMVDILEAIRGKSVISFDYQPFKYDSPKQATIHPYLLKEYNNRWFLIGLPEDLRKLKRYEFHQFGLERIKGKIKVEGKIEHYQHHGFDAATLYKNIIGISTPQGGVVQKIVLRFSPDRAKYVASNPWHQSQQKVKGTEDTFEFQLIPNMEFDSIILSFGPDVEVLEPENLRTQIANRFSEATKKYF